jgi:hypothetical protein
MLPTTKTSPSLVLVLALLANASAFQAGVNTNRSHPGAIYSRGDSPALSRKATRLGVSVGNVIQHDRSSPPDSQQANVDDYLEFLERRYKRLNEDEGGQRSAQNNADSALHVLGLESLASEKLLQKYHIASPAITPSVNVEACDATICAPSVTTTVSAMVKPLALQRKRLLDFQAAKLRTLASVLVKTLKAAPVKTAHMLVDHSGGKKTVSMTLAVMSVMMFTVVRPLAHSIVSEGAYHA